MPLSLRTNAAPAVAAAPNASVSPNDRASSRSTPPANTPSPTQMPATGQAQPYSPRQIPAPKHIGTVHDLDATIYSESPDMSRQVGKGAVSIGTFRGGRSSNYLFSNGARETVIATVYNAHTRKGAVIHLDRSSKTQIDHMMSTVMDAVGYTGARPKDIHANLIGGIWMTGPDIGGPLMQAFSEQSIQARWDDWSSSSCYARTYGATLDLTRGGLTIFEQSLQFENEPAEAPNHRALVISTLDVPTKTGPSAPQVRSCDPPGASSSSGAFSSVSDWVVGPSLSDIPDETSFYTQSSTQFDSRLDSRSDVPFDTHLNTLTFSLEQASRSVSDESYAVPTISRQNSNLSDLSNTVSIDRLSEFSDKSAQVKWLKYDASGLAFFVETDSKTFRKFKQALTERANYFALSETEVTNNTAASARRGSVDSRRNSLSPGDALDVNPSALNTSFRSVSQSSRQTMASYDRVKLVEIVQALARSPEYDFKLHWVSGRPPNSGVSSAASSRSASSASSGSHASHQSDRSATASASSNASAKPLLDGVDAVAHGFTRPIVSTSKYQRQYNALAARDTGDKAALDTLIQRLALVDKTTNKLIDPIESHLAHLTHFSSGQLRNEVTNLCKSKPTIFSVDIAGFHKTGGGRGALRLVHSVTPQNEVCLVAIADTHTQPYKLI